MTCEAIYEELIKKLSEPKAISLLSIKASDADGKSNKANGGVGAADQDGAIKATGEDLLNPDDPRTGPYRRGEDGDKESMGQIVEEIRGDLISKLQGNAAAWAKTELEASKKHQVDWRAMLRAWLIDRVKSDWSTWPPAKKYLHRGLFMPSCGVQAPGHLVFAIDTSGSMSDNVLSEIIGEIRSFRETFPTKLTILQADAEVSAVDEFGQMDGTELPELYRVVGRGGTSFVPVFEWVEEHLYDQTVALIYATDGYGTFPSRPAPYPCIWMVTPQGADEEKFPFGGVFQLC